MSDKFGDPKFRQTRYLFLEFELDFEEFLPSCSTQVINKYLVKDKYFSMTCSVILKIL